MELFLFEPIDVETMSESTGARLVVHNHTIFPAFFDGIYIPSGMQNNIMVERKFSSHLEQPYSDCTKNIDINYPSKLVKAILSTGYSYTQQNCFYTCFQFYLIENCGCYDFSSFVPINTYMNATNLQPCLNFSQINCDSKVNLNSF